MSKSHRVPTADVNLNDLLHDPPSESTKPPPSASNQSAVDFAVSSDGVCIDQRFDHEARMRDSADANARPQNHTDADFDVGNNGQARDRRQEKQTHDFADVPKYTAPTPYKYVPPDIPGPSWVTVFVLGAIALVIMLINSLMPPKRRPDSFVPIPTPTDIKPFVIPDGIPKYPK